LSRVSIGPAPIPSVRATPLQAAKAAPHKKFLHRNFFSSRIESVAGRESAPHQLLLHPPPLVEVSAIPADCAFFWPSGATARVSPEKIVFGSPLATQKLAPVMSQSGWPHIGQSARLSLQVRKLSWKCCNRWRLFAKIARLSAPATLQGSLAWQTPRSMEESGASCW